MMAILIVCMLTTGAFWRVLKGALRIAGICMLVLAAVAAFFTLMFVAAYGF